MGVASTYRTYTPDDKKAFKELKAEAQTALGIDIKLNDFITAVEPSFETPEHLKGI